MASTYDSAENIATPPPESDFHDDQIRALLASPLYLQKREANVERTQVYHSVTENLMSSASQDPISTGRPGALLFSSTNKLNPETFSDSEHFSLRHQQVLGNNEPLFRFSNPETSVKSIQEGHRDHMLAEAKCEVMKQEFKVDSLNTCIREPQRQPHSQRLELDEVICGNEESRRGQVRLRERESSSKYSGQKHP